MAPRHILKYRDLTANKEELADELKRKFEGIELVFFGKKILHTAI